jgi:hypothetical protein
MRRILLVLAVTLGTAAIAVPVAFAASPHYVVGPNVTIGNNTLTVSWKAAGLGNTATSANFALTGTVTVTAQCFTRSGNPVNGVPKTDTNDVNSTGTFDVRNGSVTGSLSVSPLSTLTCTGSQQVRILSASYDLFLNGDSLPEVHLTGSF